MHRFALTSERRTALAAATVPTSADALFNLLIKFLHGKTLPVVFTNDTGYSLMGASRIDDIGEIQITQVEPGVEMTIELPPSITYYTIKTLPPSVIPHEALTDIERVENSLLGARYLFVVVTLSVAFTNIDQQLYYEPYQYLLKIEQAAIHRMRLNKRMTSVAALIIEHQQRTEADVHDAIAHLQSISHAPLTSVEYQSSLQHTRPLGTHVVITRNHRQSPTPMKRRKDTF